MQTTRAIRPRLSAAILAATAVLVLALAAGAMARTTIEDAKRETRALSKNGRLDIIRATADRRSGTLIHTVTMRKPVHPDRRFEQPGILINTRGGVRTEAEYEVFGRRVLRFRENGDPVPIGSARRSARGRTWTYRFGAAQIPNLDRHYGWAATIAKGRIFDVAPNGRYAQARAQARLLQAAIAR